MVTLGYMHYEYDCCVYFRVLADGSYIFLARYVDDMLIAAKSKKETVKLKSLLSKEFDMKDLGATKKILGIEIHRDRGASKLWLSQKGYLKKVLERFSMLDAKPISTPLSTHFKLSSQLCPSSDEELKYMSKVPYANAVRCLMYLMVCTRPDISHAVSVVSRYMVDLGKEHWNAVKWIFRYLTGTHDFGILFDQRASIEAVAMWIQTM